MRIDRDRTDCLWIFMGGKNNKVQKERGEKKEIIVQFSSCLVLKNIDFRIQNAERLALGTG